MDIVNHILSLLNTYVSTDNVKLVIMNNIFVWGKSYKIIFTFEITLNTTWKLLISNTYE